MENKWGWQNLSKREIWMEKERRKVKMHFFPRLTVIRCKRSACHWEKNASCLVVSLKRENCAVFAQKKGFLIRYETRMFQRETCVCFGDTVFIWGEVEGGRCLITAIVLSLNDKSWSTKSLLTQNHSWALKAWLPNLNCPDYNLELWFNFQMESSNLFL